MKVNKGSPSWITSLVMGCFFLVLGAISWYSAILFLQEKEAAYIAELKQYQSKVLFVESEVLAGQLVTPVIRARELAKARIFRAAIANFLSMNKEKKAKAQEDFENFIDVAGFRAGHLFSIEGSLRATTMDKLDSTESAYYAPVRKVAATRIPHLSTLYVSKGEVVSDLFIPVYPSNVLSDSATPEYILTLVVPLQNLLRNFLASNRNLNYQSNIRLIQQNAEGGFEEIVVAFPDMIKIIPIKASLKEVKEVKFGKRLDLNGSGLVYSSVVYISALQWWIAAETDEAVIAAPMRKNQDMLIPLLIFGGLLAFFFTASVVLFFSRYRHHKGKMTLAGELVPMRETLAMGKRINDALPIPLCLRNMENEEIVYANEAFAVMCDKPLSVIRSLSIAELFNAAEADVLQHGDQMLAMSGSSSYSQELEVFQGPIPSLYEVVSLQCESENDLPPDTLLLFREITQERESHTQEVEMRQQIIDALVRAVESVPFLDGHTSLLRQLSVEMAETLLLGDADCATVEASAILSQVGKTFIPKKIMQKEGKLTPEEIQETRRYVEHTCRIIQGIKFHLPIIETIGQMQENLDGSGYPNGLKGNEVSMLARILGVANTFSALVKKRSYRKAKTAKQAVEILRKSTGRYDETVLRALEAVVESSHGRSIMRENDIEIDDE
ncbi:MAG: PAS sensor protein [Pseudodesulfovibrio sp.]|nr:PAS sensor protein [Pseudodesulfovibrio sp.]